MAETIIHWVWPGSDGVLELREIPLSTHDLQTVASLEGFATRTAQLRFGGRVHPVLVYRTSSGSEFICADALPAPDAGDELMD